MASGVASSRSARKRIFDAFEELDRHEQIEVVGELCGRIPDDNGVNGLTAAQEADLNRRIAKYRAGKAVMIPWEQVKAEIEARLRSMRSPSKKKPRRT